MYDLVSLILWFGSCVECVCVYCVFLLAEGDTSYVHMALSVESLIYEYHHLTGDLFPS